jgi:hypothetical protein
MPPKIPVCVGCRAVFEHSVEQGRLIAALREELEEEKKKREKLEQHVKKAIETMTALHQLQPPPQ